MCSVEGCEGKVRSLGLCYAHYMRFYRNGTTEFKRSPKPYIHSGGYRLIPAKGHFLSRGSSHAYEHRINFHTENGDGPFKCNWCGKDVTWDDMDVDHLDTIKTNNDPSNLVASCPPCNRGRSKENRLASLVKSVARMITANGETLSVSEWSRRSGLSRTSIISRIENGWSADRAVSQPRGKFGPKKSQIEPPGGEINFRDLVD